MPFRGQSKIGRLGGVRRAVRDEHLALAAGGDLADRDDGCSDIRADEADALLMAGAEGVVPLI